MDIQNKDYLEDCFRIAKIVLLEAMKKAGHITLGIDVQYMELL